jgi:dihydroorotase
MELLIKSAKIIDTGSKFNQKIKDILIKNETIIKIADHIDKEKNTELFSAGNLHVSPGWIDIHTNLRDPGYEHKENIDSGIQAAIAGGYTALACSPNTHPAIHSKSEVEYILNKSSSKAVNIYPIGAITKNLEGKDISEMFDMRQAGAVAFSDGKKNIKNSGMMKIAMLYAKGIDALLIVHAEDSDLMPGGQVNEGIYSLRSGLSGTPALAEEIMVSRNIELAKYIDTRIHFLAISTQGSVDLIRAAKAAGVKVTCGVNMCNLFLDDSHIESFDTNYKLNPPLRSKKDIDALIQGLKDGCIDIINSDHTPEDEESKIVEFDHARYGIIALETAFASINSCLKEKLNIEQLIEKIAINPRKILNITIPVIEEGKTANLTLFDPELKWKFETADIKSKSKNTPFVGREFTGKVLGICNKGIFN